MTFKYADLSTDKNGLRLEFVIDDERSLAARRAIPIPRTAAQFDSYTCPRPMRLGEVADAIYGDFGLWGLLADWNGLPDPAQWLLSRRLPTGYRVLYMPVPRYKAYARRARVPHLGGLRVEEVE